MDEALKNDVHIETSSSNDIPIVRALFEGKINKNTYILCNGFKDASLHGADYRSVERRFVNCVPIIDTLSEFDVYEQR